MAAGKGQVLGRFPWFALFLRRARRLRPDLLMRPPAVDVATPSSQTLPSRCHLDQNGLSTGGEGVAEAEELDAWHR